MAPEPATLPYRPCVGIVLINDEGKVLIGRRADMKPAAWQMPQGGVDDGEDPLQAGLRELAEETGVTACEVLDITPDWLTYDFPPEAVRKGIKSRYRGQKQKWILARFTGSDKDIHLSAHTVEFDAWRWADSDEVLRLIVEFKRPVYQAALDRFARFLSR
ncbi:RNA pyrophosphohydrolase [Nisaea denitrificans]|uniref:RNA pyrophosphohydrolase n=1 Tax=Nisaea denitrificans TaxID=390877 RepID=UPI0003F94FC9|nr:RNA pyrophosphohydrolase [Nisaea denitrificans]